MQVSIHVTGHDNFHASSGQYSNNFTYESTIIRIIKTRESCTVIEGGLHTGIIFHENVHKNVIKQNVSV